MSQYPGLHRVTPEPGYGVYHHLIQDIFAHV